MVAPDYSFVVFTEGGCFFCALRPAFLFPPFEHPEHGEAERHEGKQQERVTSRPIPTATNPIKTAKVAGKDSEMRWVRRISCGLRSGCTALRPEFMYHQSAHMMSPVRSRVAK
jgi:hypothetical protein